MILTREQRAARRIFCGQVVLNVPISDPEFRSQIELERSYLDTIDALQVNLDLSKQIESCGHPIQCLVGDDYGHFTCQWCASESRHAAELAGAYLAASDVEMFTAVIMQHASNDISMEQVRTISHECAERTAGLSPASAKRALALVEAQARLEEHYTWPNPPLHSVDVKDWARHLRELSLADSKRIAELETQVRELEGKVE